MHFIFRLSREIVALHNKSALYRAFYHSQQGVYGYKPEQIASAFEVDDEVSKNRAQNPNLYRFICAYRDHGHRLAELDPLKLMQARSIPNLQPEKYGLNNAEKFNLKGLMNIGKDEATLDEIVHKLQTIYCGPISFEYTYVMHDKEREWLTQNIESVMMDDLKSADRILLAEDMLKSQALDNFFASKLPTVKRYGAEGAESMFGFFNEVFKESAKCSIEDVQIGMPHRGRINLLLGKLNVPAVILLRMMKGLPADYGEEDEYRCVGDVASHAMASTDINVNGKSLHVNVLRNPSHLEVGLRKIFIELFDKYAVNGVVLGKTRGRQQSLRDGDYALEMNGSIGDKVLCIQVHGDASFAGQGIVMEGLAMSAVPHFNVGGSIHLIVNNQLGFTAPSDRSRSSMYCSDVMKMICAPVIHVNGDYPDAVLKASKIAFDYREKFRKDVLVDLVSYRQWGHNELDNPTFTNPQMYQAISSRSSVPNSYANNLIEEGIVTRDALDKVVSNETTYCNEQLKLAETYKPKSEYLNKQWAGYQRVSKHISSWNTGFDTSILKFVGMKSVTVPNNFALHPHLNKTFVKNRLKKLEQGSNIDWATAEAMAIGSLLYQGYNVRLCGQDVGRGTFSHRHAMLVDQDTNEMYIPLNDISNDQKGFYEVANSILSEEAVLGFEYGMSIESPTRLNIWEAQFGDFYNGAQIIIDTFVTSSDVKWLQQSGLVMLLPHGFDGAGSDHSSSHVERFLQVEDFKLNLIEKLVLSSAQKSFEPLTQFPTSEGSYLILMNELTNGRNINYVIIFSIYTAEKMDAGDQEHFSAITIVSKDMALCDSKENVIDGDDVNIEITHPTTPAQYFHLLRRQMIRNYRVPLVIVSPKILLRLPAATSVLHDMAPGSSFVPVFGDSIVDPHGVTKVIFCSGQHYYNLIKWRSSISAMDFAIIRLEALCPFPAQKLQAELAKYPKAKKFIWSQEEPQNMGAWTYIGPRFKNLVGCELTYAGRRILGVTAVGLKSLHEVEVEKIMKDTFTL
ncbi:putative 2-oxoglutarate dehydrogenase E1 component DHKTD1, mitochondrial [Nymphon striatum]|nr:putative 2-oxoglutarate dehydrogenase E1 component DHKTD1, mitochondrial [Nymphon striatum]